MNQRHLKKIKYTYYYFVLKLSLELPTFERFVTATFNEVLDQYFKTLKICCPNVTKCYYYYKNKNIVP